MTILGDHARRVNLMLCEPHLHIRTLFQVDALDEAYFAGELGEDYRRSARALAEEADAFEQRAVGDSRGGEDELFAGGKILRLVDLVFIFNTHASEALLLVG